MGLKEDIQLKIKDSIRQKVADSMPADKTLGGFFSNLKTDIVDFGKGILFLGRQGVTHPIESFKNVSSTGFELMKQINNTSRDAVGNIIETGLNPIQKARELKNSVQDLRKISYEELKNTLTDINQQSINLRKEGTRGEKNLAALGGGLLTDTIQEITHPIEFAYEKPFTFGLDTLAIGGGKVIGKPVKTLSKTPPGKKLIRGIEDTFVPNAKLKREGFGKFVDDLEKTKGNIFNSQQRIIESTAKKFEKEFRINKAERFEFSDTIDKLRRSGDDIKATSKNPRIQTAIDWWLDQEVPKIQRASGLPKEKAITNYIHHFFPDRVSSAESKFTTPLQLSKKKFLKKSKDVAGFSRDPIVSISAIKSKVALAAMKDAFINRTIKTYAKDIERLKSTLASKIGLDEVAKLEKNNKLNSRLKSEFGLEEYKPQGSLRFFNSQDGTVGVTKKVETHLLPQGVVDELNKFSSKQQQNVLFKGLDFFNRNWKPLATSVRPRYSTRNVVGNLYNGVYLGNMKLTAMPKAAELALKDYFNELRTLNTPAGKMSRAILPKFEGLGLFKEALKEGVIGRGFFGADVHDMAKIADSSDDIINAINKVKNPAEVYRIPALRQYMQIAQNVATALEDNARLALYIDRRNKGFSKARAKADVNKYLFDYLTGLSETDKVIKKLVPFWSWTRFNVPLQSEGLITKKLKNAVVNRLGDPVTTAVEDKDDFSKFLTPEEKEAGLIKVGEVEKDGEVFNKYIRTESVLPVNDLTRIIDILNFLRFEPDFQALGINPLIGLAEKIRTNRGFFGNLIERFPGEQKKFLGETFSGKTVEKLKLIPFLSELNKAVGGSATEETILPGGVRLEQVLSPLGTTLKNQKDLEFFSILEREKELNGSYEAGLKSLYKRYLIKEQNEPGEKVFKENVERLERLLKQKGLTELNLLPIKIKAIKAGIQESVKEDIQAQIREQTQTKEESK